MSPAAQKSPSRSARRHRGDARLVGGAKRLVALLTILLALSTGLALLRAQSATSFGQPVALVVDRPELAPDFTAAVGDELARLLAPGERLLPIAAPGAGNLGPERTLRLLLGEAEATDAAVDLPQSAYPAVRVSLLDAGLWPPGDGTLAAAPVVARDVDSLLAAFGLAGDAEVWIVVDAASAARLAGSSAPSPGQIATPGGARLRVTTAASLAVEAPRAMSVAYFAPSAPLADTALLGQLRSAGTIAFAADARFADAGALAATGSAQRERLARRTALALADRLRGLEPPAGRPPVPPLRLTVNEATAEALGVALPWDLLVGADVLPAASAPADHLTYVEAVRLATANSYAVTASAYGARAAEARSHRARAALMPRVGVGPEARLIDADLAGAALGGANPEELVSVTGSVEQVLLDAGAFGRYAAAKDRAAAEAIGLRTTQLDAAAYGATAFTQVLRARTASSLAREQAERLAVDLRAAQSRLRAGTASTAEVARVESALAQARTDLAAALGREQAAVYDLNRALDRPLDTPVALAHYTPRQQRARDGELVVDPAAPLDTALAEPVAEPHRLLGDGAVAPLLTTRAATEAAAGVHAARAMSASPELASLGALVEAREHEMRAARLSFLPRISAYASGTERVHVGGAGAGAPPENLPVLAYPDQFWSVGVRASVTLFEGGGRIAERREAEAELLAARAERADVELALAARARTATALLAAAQTAYDQAELAARAARRSYDITARLYRAGEVDVIPLLDAETDLEVADRRAASAAYDILDRYTDLQRATARFDALPPGQLPGIGAVISRQPER